MIETIITSLEEIEIKQLIDEKIVMNDKHLKYLPRLILDSEYLPMRLKRYWEYDLINFQQKLQEYIQVDLDDYRKLSIDPRSFSVMQLKLRKEYDVDLDEKRKILAWEINNFLWKYQIILFGLIPLFRLYNMYIGFLLEKAIQRQHDEKVEKVEENTLHPSITIHEKVKEVEENTLQPLIIMHEKDEENKKDMVHIKKNEEKGLVVDSVSNIPGLTYKEFFKWFVNKNKEVGILGWKGIGEAWKKYKIENNIKNKK